MTIEAIQALAAQTPVLEPTNNTPRPLTPELSPSVPFPVEAMPTVLAEAIEATHAITQAPIDLIAQAFLAVASLVAQAHVNIVALDGALKPCSLFIMSVADSGERKSSCDGFAMRPIKRHEQSLYHNYKSERQAYQNELDAYTATRKSILNQSPKGNGKVVDNNQHKQSMQQALEALGEAPKAPFDCAITCEEPTFPALVKSLYGGYPSMGIFSNEGGEMLGGHAMNNDNRLRTITGFSKMWDGDELKHKRVEGGETRLVDKRLSMHLMIQPHLAVRFMTDPDISKQGFGARFLVAFPPSAMGTRFRTNVSKIKAEQTLAHYCDELEKALKRPLPLGDNKFSQELEPKTVAPVEAAQTLLDGFYNTLERQLAPDGVLRPIAGFVNKLPEQALRIALCLAFVEDHTVEQLSAEQLQRGIMIAEYYLAQRLRLSDPEADNRDLSNAEDLKQWLKQKWKEPFISSADVGQSGPKHLRKAEVAHSALQTLAEYGWLTSLDVAKHIRGKVRQHCYALHESLTTLGGYHG